MRGFIFEGANGEIINEIDIPQNLKDLAVQKRLELIESLANIDENIEELFLNEKEIDEATLNKAIRK